MSNKGITTAVIVIFILGAGYFVYNKINYNPQPFTPPSELLASIHPIDASASAAPGEELTVTLREQNSSNELGIATLKDVKGKTQVNLKIAGAPQTAQPAHIHIGSCPSPLEVKYPLTDLVNGLSQTVLDVSLTELKAMLPLAINIHKSSTEIKSYVTCGDVK